MWVTVLFRSLATLNDVGLDLVNIVADDIAVAT